MARHLAIGDIHGCYDAFRTLCDFVKLRKDDIVVTLGDYPDRGPNTNAVLDWLIHLSEMHDLKPLRGNHDIMMLDARTGKSKYRRWCDVGGDATLRSYAPFDGDAGKLDDVPEHHWRFLADELLPYFETDTHIFVHANAYPDMPDLGHRGLSGKSGDESNRQATLLRTHGARAPITGGFTAGPRR